MDKEYPYIHKLKNNDTDTLNFEKMIEPHYHIIHRYVSCRISDRFEAENIMQEVLLLAWVHLDRLKDINSFKNWLIIIASNCCKKYYAKNKRAIRPIEDDALQFIIDKQRLSESDNDYDYLYEAINKLPQNQRQAIDDFYFNNLKMREISFIRNIPEGTVKSRLHGAKQNLKCRLEKKMDKKFKNILPLKRPQINIDPKKDASFDVIVNEVPWMYCDLRVGNKIIWGIYDAPDWKLTDCAVTNTKRYANIHNIDCVEIEVHDYENPKNIKPNKTSNLYVHSDENQIQYVAASRVENDVYKMISLFDDEFIKNYYVDFPRKVKDFGFDLYEGRDYSKISFPSDSDSILLGAGVFDVTIDGKTFECLRVIDRWQESPRILVENYMSKDGRSILFRRYNHPVWKLDKYKKRWDEKLPNASELFINGEKYVHWYDCLSDIAFT